MSTNPNNAVGTNGAFGGRTSVNALNDVLAAFNGSGILSGWKCVPSSGMTVAIGGQDNDIRDVAIAEDSYGNRTTINNISQAPISVTISPSSTSSQRYTSIVAYVNSPTNASNTSLDNPTVVGLIAVDDLGVPDDSTIRTAITADGGTGSAAYYVVLATIFIPPNMTTITADYIEQENLAARPSVLMQSDMLHDWRPLFVGSSDLYTSQTIALNSTSDIFDFLRFTFENSDRDSASIDVPAVVGKYVTLAISHLEANLAAYNIKIAEVEIRASELRVNRKATQFSTNGSPISQSGLLFLTGVYGYKL